jgi:hypothetical protein
MEVVERTETRKGWRQVRLSIVLSVGLLMAIVGASALVVGSAQAQPFAPRLEGTTTPIPECGLNWRTVASSNSGTNSNQLRGVAVVSANDVWAVGDYAGGSAFQTLTMHYTNGQWNTVPSPNLGTSGNHLSGVAAVSANDVWAVGYYYDNSSNRDQTLTMHYADGQWTVVTSPNVGTSQNNLTGVAAVSANDVWAVGDYVNGSAFQTLTMHYADGQWTVVTSPNISTSGNFLTGVTAVSANDVWAVGHYYDDDNKREQTLTMHYADGQWTVVTSPNSETSNSYLTGVATAAANDVWAVGYYGPIGGPYQTLTMHYTGGQWTLVPSPNVDTGSNALSGVTAVSANDVWAVGYYYNSSGDTEQTLAIHYTGGQWTVVSSPNVGTSQNFLSAVAAVSVNDVWAVGRYLSMTPTPAYQTLTMHYSDPCVTSTPTATATATATSTPTPDCGQNWRPVTSPSVGTNENYLNAVAAVSANDIWAVGWYRVNNTRTETLTMHYTNGAWTVVPSPNVGDGGNELYGVVAVSANDVWAVGYYRLDGLGSTRTLTMHYTNGAWTVVPSPNPGSSSNELVGVAAVSANDVWAVGDYTDGTGYSQTLTMHYADGQWTVVPSPNAGISNNSLKAVAAVSANDVWAVGWYADGYNQTLAMHYTNGAWTVVPSPSPGSRNHYLKGVAAVSANDVWAVGYYENNAPGDLRTLTMRYRDGEWTLAPSPDAGTNSIFLYGVAAVSANDVWAVGTSSTGGDFQTLTMHYTNGQWTVVPSGNMGSSENVLKGVAVVSANDVWAVGHYISGTGFQTLTAHSSGPCVTATPTATATPNVEATSTPTVCTLQFTDVPADNTFYQYVRCLACQGIVSGYACGAEGEPCDGDNNPYFRPNANVTRGQIAKIVSNSAGYDEDPGPQIYEDVAADNPFYQWINRLSNRGHMGGYRCGGEGEPCGVEEMPYFRPFANATRAQLAKIVSNTAGLTDTGAEQIFTDVPPENGFYVWIQRLASRGIMGGYACGGESEPCDDQERPYFRPYNSVTRGQTSKIVAGAFFPNCLTP